MSEIGFETINVEHACANVPNDKRWNGRNVIKDNLGPLWGGGSGNLTKPDQNESTDQWDER
eukprot:3474714-Lingulodinium_polyedra.AAC.1